MKKLFKFLFFVGFVCAVVMVATKASRRRATQHPVPWETPTVEAPPEDAARVRDSESEGMTPGAEEAPVDIAVGSTGEAVVSELAAPGAAEALLKASQPAEAPLDVASDEGMTPSDREPDEDVALDSSGQPLVSELAAPNAEVAALDAEAALVDALEESEAAEKAAPEAPDTQEDEDSSPLDAALTAAEVAGAASVGAVASGVESLGSAAADEPAETDFLTRAFDELAATPDDEAAITALETEPEVRADENLLSSVEEALGDLEPAPIVPPPRRTAESYLDEGNVYFNVGQYGLAIERYGQAISLDNSLTAAFYNRANAHTRAGDFELALADYDRALELQPMDADALNNRGMLHLYRSNYSSALGDFNRALELDPSDTTVMVNRGLAQLHSGNAAAALVDFREAATMDDGDAAAQYGAAQAAATMGNRDEALRHVGRALELDAGYAREAAADPRLSLLSGDEEFMRLLRQSGTRTS